MEKWFDWGNKILRHGKIGMLKLYNWLLVWIQWELDEERALSFEEELLNKI